MKNVEIDVLEKPCLTEVKQRGITIGLPKNPEHGERLFPLTPEAVKVLTDEYAFRIYIETGAGHEIHYSDAVYASHGAIICDRQATLRTDIVIAAAPLSKTDIGQMRRNATVWSVLEPARMPARMIEALNERAITTLSLPALCDAEDNCPVADILNEIYGRAAVSVAAGLLADGVHGKGILIGGVTGVVPCETVIIGSGTAGIAAAGSASGLGSIVRIFDNDLCRLRHAQTMLNNNVIGSALHRKVYLAALKSADVIINTLKREEAREAVIGYEDTQLLKKGAILFDINSADNSVFPALKQTDLSPARDAMPDLTERICFVNAGSTVPRTSAMALSNVLVPIMANLALADDRTFMDAVRMDSGLRTGLVTFGGKLINIEAAKATGLKWVDPALFLNLS